MVCTKCLNFPSIIEFINKNGKEAHCSFCNFKRGAVAPKDIVFQYILDSLSEHIVPLSSFQKLESLFYNADEDLITYETSFDLLQHYEKEIHEGIHNLLVDFLDEELFSNELMINLVDSYRYEDDVYDPTSFEWDNLVLNFNHLYRYKTDKIISFLDRMILPLLRNTSIKSEHIEKIDKDKKIYRGRICQNNDAVKQVISSPYSELGPTPLAFSSDQRMSAQGISSFYGALERRTCLPELRPAVGEIIITGAFYPLVKLNLLRLKDLNRVSVSKLDILADPFSKEIPDKIAGVRFASNLYWELIKPSISNNKSTYRITQLFIEILRSKFYQQIHGVIFPSVQSCGKGKNIVLFPEYSITKNVLGDIYNPYFNLSDAKISDWHGNDSVLLFDENSLVTHKVQRVRVETEDT